MTNSWEMEYYDDHAKKLKQLCSSQKNIKGTKWSISSTPSAQDYTMLCTAGGPRQILERSKAL